MQPSLMRDTAAYTKRHRKAKLGKRILAVLIALVIGFTAYAMIFPAITQSNQTACNMAEHIHDSACYENERVVICQQEESAEHTHEDVCYDLEPVLTCPLVEHIHDETCAADATPTDPMADLGIGTIADEVYWQKVSSIDDTSANYLIVPSSANVALGVQRSGGSYSGTKVSITLTEMAEAAGYYTVAGVTDACKWNFTQSGAGYVIKNSSYTSYGLNLSSTSYIGTSTTTNTLAYTESSETFTIGYNNYYLIYRNSSFSRSRSYSNYRPMVIYKEVSSLPDSGGDTESGDSTTDPNVKPEYPAYVEVSSKKTALRYWVASAVPTTPILLPPNWKAFSGAWKVMTDGFKAINRFYTATMTTTFSLPMTPIPSVLPSQRWDKNTPLPKNSASKCPWTWYLCWTLPVV